MNAANSGHPGLPMGCAPMTFVLFTEFLKADPKDPKWPNRDRFVLSAGHGSMLQYSLLHLMGYNLGVRGRRNRGRFLGGRTLVVAGVCVGRQTVGVCDLVAVTALIGWLTASGEREGSSGEAQHTSTAVKKRT